MPETIVLTGIKPTGSPHVGNYIGAIKPALALAESPEATSLYFIADYHALNSVQDAKELRHLTYEIAAAWLAMGLDPKKVIFYRQSDIPEIFELAWILSCFTAKGLMNRAHAYKAAVAQNQEQGQEDLDAGINMGLFSYPVLMAADILAFDTKWVPVGKDQVQHVEIARDIAERINLTYRGDVLKIPAAKIGEDTATILGLDGRKMSKSYDNTLPLFMAPADFQKRVMRFVTDSSSPTEPKDPSKSPLFTLYREFATPEETEAMRKQFETGIGWGKVKQELAAVLNRKLEEPRRIYADLMANTARIDAMLQEGAQKARKRARATLDRVRAAIGIQS